MNIDKYPTPKTDAAKFEIRGRGTPLPDTVVYESFARDLERKLAKCRDALIQIGKTSSSTRIRREANQTWKDTEP